MTYTPTVYTWRDTMCPTDQSFRAGGQAIDGGMTLGGALVSNPEPGGRAEILLSFAQAFKPEAAVDASWTASRIMNGAIFNYRLFGSVQLVPADGLNIVDSGQTWANGAAWANDANWQANPFALVSAAAARGAPEFQVDMSIPGEVLKIGHVVGFYSAGFNFAHMVMDIVYLGGTATVTIEPPLRRALAVDDLMMFRPAMTVYCANPNEVLGRVQQRRAVSFGSIRFVEALV